MLQILNSCSGCYACEQICPKSCISMNIDKEGFWYPKIDKEKCINCNLCEKVCPIIAPLLNIETKSPIAYAAYNTDEEARMKSSSGGVFTALAEYILSLAGVVFGAAFQDDFSVSHICVENIEGLEKLRGSKYLQSKIGNTYKEAKRFLDGGRIVLFTGTPCQIEGLIAFLGKDYENLYTQDLICHGVPSPLVWQKYVKYREKKAVSSTRRTFFRQKHFGWKMFSVQFEFTNCTEYIKPFPNDSFMTAFLRNWCLRPSCYDCHFKKKHRLSDITLADFWGIENVCPEMDDDHGTSFVVLNTDKGKRLFEMIRNDLICRKTAIEDGIKYNPSMIESVKQPKERAYFIRRVTSRNFEKYVNKLLRNSEKRGMKRLISKAKRVIKKCFPLER